VKINTIECIPGYQVSGDSHAFTAKNMGSPWGTRVQRERLGRNAATAHVLMVIADVPGSRSALSLVRRT
jgi:hypothetical protein